MLEPPGEPRQVRGTETLFGLAVEHVHVRVGGGQTVRDLTGPVG